MEVQGGKLKGQGHAVESSRRSNLARFYCKTKGFPLQPLYLKEETQRKTCPLLSNTAESCKKELMLLGCSGKQEKEVWSEITGKGIPQFKINTHFRQPPYLRAV